MVKYKSSGKQSTKNKKYREDLNTMQNANFTYQLVRRGRGTDIYIVDNIDGMTALDIINACDPNNFGGQVYGKKVEVYTD